jgi:(2Fe-2S) ferredoxin
VVATCRSKLGIDFGETTADGSFTLIEVECLGACVNAPILQVNDDFYEDLDAASTEALLDALGRGEVPPMGSVTGRQTSAPAGGPTTLTTLVFDGETDAA